MAKIKACGDMLTITSDVTYEIYNKVRRFSPETLKLKDQEGNEYFRIDFNEECHHEVSEFGIIFHSVDTQGKMFLTTGNVVQGIHNDVQEERKLITDRYGNILVKIGTIEANIMEKLNVINGIAGAVQESIEICGEQEENND